MPDEPTTEPSDEDLVGRFREGDHHAFGILVDRHGTRLYRFLVGWLRRSDLAEEIAQAAFVKAAIRIDQLAAGRAFLSWLMTIARMTALDHLRSNPAHRNLPLEAAPERAAPGDHQIAFDVRRVLDALSEDDREIVMLSDFLGMETAEIATTLEISASATKMRIQRARRRFRELYQAREP